MEVHCWSVPIAWVFDAPRNHVIAISVPQELEMHADLLEIVFVKLTYRWNFNSLHLG